MTGARLGAGRVFDSLVAELTSPLNDALKRAGWGIAVAIPAALAVFFFSFAGFVWTEQNYGTVVAALIVGAGFLLVTGAIVGTAIVLHRRARARTPPKTTSQWWKDPTVIAVGVELVRVIGIRRIVPVVALGAVIVGALGSFERKRDGTDTQ
jgi:hypothetical protein